MRPVIFLLLFLQIISVSGVNVKNCNSALITANYRDKFRFVTPVNPTPLPVIRSNDYLKLKGELRVVEVVLTEPHYVTGLAIRVNTDQKSPCNYIESDIDLSDYELTVNDKRINIPNRSIVNNTFVEVSFSAIYATKVQVSKQQQIDIYSQ